MKMKRIRMKKSTQIKIILIKSTQMKKSKRMKSMQMKSIFELKIVLSEKQPSNVYLTKPKRKVHPVKKIYRKVKCT